MICPDFSHGYSLHASSRWAGCVKKHLWAFFRKNPALALFLKSPVQWSKNLQMNFPSNEEHITEGTSLEEGPQNPPPDTSLSIPVTTHLKLHHATTLIHPQCPALLQSPQVGTEQWPHSEYSLRGVPTPSSTPMLEPIRLPLHTLCSRNYSSYNKKNFLGLRGQTHLLAGQMPELEGEVDSTHLICSHGNRPWPLFSFR